MSKRLTHEEFITRSTSKHGDKYGYELVKYTTNREFIDIICPVHGVFTQQAAEHLRGRGCAKCAQALLGKLNTRSKESFLSEALEKFGGLYKYDDIEYINMSTPVELLCASHGRFSVKPAALLKGQGCPECYRHNASLQKPNVEAWVKRAKSSKYFDGYKLYLIKILTEKDEFIKVGVTFTSLHRRIKAKGYIKGDYEKVIVKEGSPERLLALEHLIKSKLREHVYIPKTYSPLTGKYELFPCYLLETIYNVINENI